MRVIDKKDTVTLTDTRVSLVSLDETAQNPEQRSYDLTVVLANCRDKTGVCSQSIRANLLVN